MDIVSLAPSNTEILYALGAGDQVCGTTSLCDYPEDALDKPNVGGWTDLDVDKVVSLEPDLALASDDLQDEIVDKICERNIEVRQFKPHTLEEVYNSIHEIGEIIGAANRADKLVKEMRSEIQEIDLEGRRIYCEEWMDPPMVSGNWIPGLVKAAGGVYMIEEGIRSREVENSEITEFDPEVIVLNVCGAGENLDTDSIRNREGWENISAVRKDQVFIIDDALLNRPGPRLTKGVRQIQNKTVE